MEWSAGQRQRHVTYEQLATHLVSNGIDKPLRIIVGSISAALALTALLTISTASGPGDTIELVAAIAAAVGAGGATVLWATRLPTRREAVAFSMGSNASIAAAALAQSDPAVALLTCTVFAAMAGYIAVFHHRGLLVYNFAVAAAVSLHEASKLMHQTSAAAALCALIVVSVLNLGMPSAIQLMVHGLGADAMLAEHDQLTGLLNRAAFHRRALTCAEERHPDQHLVLVVIDLDRFKRINDRHGHGHGDAVLIGAARAMQGALADGAVVGRLGGEEFVIAGLWRPHDVVHQVERLRMAIAALPFNVTASIGSATTRTALAGERMPELVTKLLSTADAAMYVAKRRGGDQTHCAYWDPPQSPAAT